jgi:murein DD-endopeptidase MepM/ murein hydrolase activator NlpD
LDFKRILPQGGLLTALFPKLKAYKAQKAASPGDKVLKNIDTDFKLFAKNSEKLESIANNFLLMKREVNKLAKLEKVIPATSVDKSIDSKNTSVDTTQPTKLETVKGGFNMLLLIAAVAAVGVAMNEGYKKLQDSFDLSINGALEGLSNLGGFLYDKLKQTFDEMDFSEVVKDFSAVNLKEEILSAFRTGRGIWDSLYNSNIVTKIKNYADDISSDLFPKDNSGPLTESYPLGKNDSTSPSRAPPTGKTFRESIANRESNGYDTKYGVFSGKAEINDKLVTQNTIGEIIAWQKQNKSKNTHAVGKYAFLDVESLAKNSGLSTDDLFDGKTQEILMDVVINLNKKYLESSQIQPTEANLSLAHAVGARGTKKLLNAQSSGQGHLIAADVLGFEKGSAARKTNPQLEFPVSEYISKTTSGFSNTLSTTPDKVGSGDDLTSFTALDPAYAARFNDFGAERAGGRKHAGIDLGRTEGAPVVARQSGKVIHASPYGGYGNTVIVDHGDETKALYAHMKDFSVKVGDNIQMGQSIGKVGNTNTSEGTHQPFKNSSGKLENMVPHLHLEYHLNGKPIDPKNWNNKQAQLILRQREDTASNPSGEKISQLGMDQTSGSSTKVVYIPINTPSGSSGGNNQSMASNSGNKLKEDYIAQLMWNNLVNNSG